MLPNIERGYIAVVSVMERVGHFLDRGIACLTHGGTSIALACVLGMGALITLNVILRYIFTSPLIYTEEFAAYLLIAVTYFGYVYAMRQDEHISVEVVVRLLSERIRDGLNVVTSLLALVLAGIYCWSNWEALMFSLRMHTSIGIMLIPGWIPLSILVVALPLLFLEIVAHTVKKFRAFQKGAKEGTKEEEIKVGI